LDKKGALLFENSETVSKVNNVIRLSLIPNCNKKFIIIDAPKEIRVEMRCLPALEVVIVLPEAYPSHNKPLLI
jgi:hypothetical protein